MSDVFATYQPPGVYAQEETTPLANPVGISPTVVALVGPSVGYRSFTEAVALVGTDPTRLSKLGIISGSVIVTQANGDTAAEGDDYDLTQGDGADGDSGTNDDTMDITRSDGSNIGDGEIVVVSYHYTDADYFEPLSVTSYGEVKDVFGEPFDGATGAILSPLSLAAKFAMDNGASRLILLATPGDASSVDKDDLSAGYSKLLARDEVSILVPLPVGINGTDGEPGDVLSVATSIKAHVEGAERDGIYRIAIAGFETGVTIDPTDLAAEFSSKRVMLSYPGRMSYFNGFLNTTMELAGYYHAAASAGRLASLPVQIPLTRKVIRGFTGIPGSVLSTMTRTAKDAWSKAGVAVTEPSSQKGLVCRHGVSTDPSNILTREISITRARDALINSIMDSLEGSDLIGSAIVAETPTRIKGNVQGVLETLLGREVIVAYQGLEVRQTTTDPSVIEVKFQYRPAYPLNYILIVFSIDTTTGNLVATDQTI